MLDAATKTKIMSEVDRRFDDQTKVLQDLVKGVGGGHDRVLLLWFSSQAW